MDILLYINIEIINRSCFQKTNKKQRPLNTKVNDNVISIQEQASKK